jgi:hypothetical protein
VRRVEEDGWQVDRLLDLTKMTPRPVTIGRASERLSGVPRGSTSSEGGAIRYLCLIYEDETRRAARSQKDADAFMGEYFAFRAGDVR